MKSAVNRLKRVSEEQAASTVFSDLREYVDRLEAEGELQRIEAEVDRDLEVGAVIRRSYDLKAPAPFFQKIKGYPKGFRILGAPVGTSAKPNQYYARLAISLGLGVESNPTTIMEESMTEMVGATLAPGIWWQPKTRIRGG